ncbi:hypothetical protein QQF64_002317 [Cirrhinus molitorella]|uniref:Uncharacterized protein n=2 Tax=Cirrhinus molitorella TaxID=172907 RepID=A0ABR3MPU2_9TELE|nr:hypothetical protein Q8A67_023697 [Cirrhinus molitorella]
MCVCLSAGRRSQTRALVGCGRWKSVGPDCPSHHRWSSPTKSGHINSATQTPDTCPKAVKRLSHRTLPVAECPVRPLPVIFRVQQHQTPLPGHSW